jgi:hypothetical protein
MKVEIDLKDILFDEDYGPESLNESIRRQVIDSVKREIKDGVRLRINEEINKVISEEVLSQVKLIAPDLCKNILDLEFQPVTSYGSHDGKPTTLRNRFIEDLKKQFIYRKAQYDSEKNEFTRSVDSVVSSMMSDFKSSYNKEIDASFTQEALNYATIKMKERLGIK